MTSNKDMIRHNYERGLWSEDMLQKLVLKGKLSYADYTDIVGKSVDWSVLSEEETERKLKGIIQGYMDSKAQELGYDDCATACTYMNTGVQKYDDEGVAFRSWRSAVWNKGYSILAEVKSGTKPVPTPEELIAELPKFSVNYTVA